MEDNAGRAAIPAPENIFLEEINRAIDSGALVLPTLPEVALHVQEAIDREDIAINQIAEIIASDSALSAHIIKVANSPIYRGRVEINSLQMAVGRIGTRQMRSMVISLVIKQMFQSTTEGLDDYFHKAWASSVAVAAISKTLARQVSGLDPEQAMLAGLIHNLGTLPIVVFAEEHSELVPREIEFSTLVEMLSPSVGARITESWGFPRSLIDVASQAHDIYRDNQGPADYVDVVIVACLQHAADSDHPLADVDWLAVPAFNKVGLDPEISFVEIEGVAEHLEKVQGMFN